MRIGTVLVGAGLAGAGEPPEDEKRRGSDDKHGNHDDQPEGSFEGCSRIFGGQKPCIAGQTDEDHQTDHGDQRVEQVKTGTARVMHAPEACGEAGDEGREVESAGDQPWTVRRPRDAIDEPFYRAGDCAPEDAE